MVISLYHLPDNWRSLCFQLWPQKPASAESITMCGLVPLFFLKLFYSFPGQDAITAPAKATKLTWPPSSPAVALTLSLFSALWACSIHNSLHTDFKHSEEALTKNLEPTTASTISKRLTTACPPSPGFYTNFWLCYHNPSPKQPPFLSLYPRFYSYYVTYQARHIKYLWIITFGCT